MTNAVNHIAVSVTDISRAIRWYRDILGMTVLVNPVEISYPASKAAEAEIFRACQESIWINVRQTFDLSSELH